jgi:hypothetical protein
MSMAIANNYEQAIHKPSLVAPLPQVCRPRSQIRSLSSAGLASDEYEQHFYAMMEETLLF